MCTTKTYAHSHLFKISYPDSSDHPFSHSRPKRHPSPYQLMSSLTLGKRTWAYHGLPFEQPLWSVAPLENKLVPCAWLLSGTLWTFWDYDYRGEVTTGANHSFAQDSRLDGSVIFISEIGLFNVGVWHQLPLPTLGFYWFLFFLFVVCCSFQFPVCCCSFEVSCSLRWRSFDVFAGTDTISKSFCLGDFSKFSVARFWILGCFFFWIISLFSPKNRTLKASTDLIDRKQPWG